MDNLKILFKEIDDELKQLMEKQTQLNAKSENFLKDINVAHNYGKIHGLLGLYFRVKEMLDEE